MSQRDIRGLGENRSMPLNRSMPHSYLKRSRLTLDTYTLLHRRALIKNSQPSEDDGPIPAIIRYSIGSKECKEKG